METFLLLICLLTLVGVGLLLRSARRRALDPARRVRAVRSETDSAEARLDQLTRRSLQQLRHVARDELRTSRGTNRQ